MSEDDLSTDTDPAEVAAWVVTTVSAVVVFYATVGWWAPRSWWRALTLHQGHGLNTARAVSRRCV